MLGMESMIDSVILVKSTKDGEGSLLLNMSSFQTHQSSFDLGGV